MRGVSKAAYILLPSKPADNPMRVSFPQLLAASITTVVLTVNSASAQFTGGTGTGGGTGGFGGNTGGFSSGTGSFGGTSSGFGGTGSDSFGSSATQGNSSFQPTTSSFPTGISYGRTPFGAQSNLRGPNAGGRTTGTSGSRIGTTATGGLGGGLGGLGGLALGGLGRNNRNTNLNQQNTNQNAVRTRLSASEMRAELEAPAVPAVDIMSRIDRLPNASRFQNVQVEMRGSVAIVDAANVAQADLNRLKGLIMLEPGVDDVQFVGLSSEEVQTRPSTSGD